MRFVSYRNMTKEEADAWEETFKGMPIIPTDYIEGPVDVKLKQPGSRLLSSAIKRLKEIKMSKTKKHNEDEKGIHLKSKTDDQLKDQDKVVSDRTRSEQEKSIELQRQNIEDALKDNGVNGVKVTCPTSDTWRIDKNGKSETGNITVPLTTIVAKAQAL